MLKVKIKDRKLKMLVMNGSTMELAVDVLALIAAEYHFIKSKSSADAEVYKKAIMAGVNGVDGDPGPVWED